MSTTTTEILNLLKSLTLLEAAELVIQIEESFGVMATPRLPFTGRLCGEPRAYQVILEAVVAEKRIEFIKILCHLKDWTVMEGKKFIDSAPNVLEKNVDFSTAEKLKQQLEAVGARISIQKI
jgi:large subunit ribosomal protein L7/L12